MLQALLRLQWKNVFLNPKNYLHLSRFLIINLDLINCKIGFEWAALAQLVEHRFCKPTVAGSTPVSSSTKFELRAWFPSG